MMSKFFSCLGEPFARIEERFAGNAPDIETGSTKGWGLLHAGSPQAKLRSTNRPHVPTRSGTNEENIELLYFRHVFALSDRVEEERNGESEK